MIFLKTEDEIELMRVANLLVGKTLAEVGKNVLPGVTTNQLNKVAEEYIRDHGATPTFLGFPNPYGEPFPAAICASVNDQVVHGVPNDEPLKDGDIVSVKADNERGTVFNHVQIRVDDSFTLEMHIDTDEANAAKIATGQTVTIMK